MEILRVAGGGDAPWIIEVAGEPGEFADPVALRDALRNDQELLRRASDSTRDINGLRRVLDADPAEVEADGVSFVGPDGSRVAFTPRPGAGPG